MFQREVTANPLKLHFPHQQITLFVGRIVTSAAVISPFCLSAIDNCSHSHLGTILGWIQVPLMERSLHTGSDLEWNMQPKMHIFVEPPQTKQKNHSQATTQTSRKRINLVVSKQQASALKCKSNQENLICLNRCCQDNTVQWRSKVRSWRILQSVWSSSENPESIHERRTAASSLLSNLNRELMDFCGLVTRFWWNWLKIHLCRFCFIPPVLRSLIKSAVKAPPRLERAAVTEAARYFYPKSFTFTLKEGHFTACKEPLQTSGSVSAQ